MKEKIDFKILLEELRGKIREFYPYFLAFYLLSLVVALFSKTWKSFFYWPAFHGALFVFTVFFLLTIRLNFHFHFKPINFKSINFKPNLDLKKKGLLLFTVSLRIIEFIAVWARQFLGLVGHLVKNYFFFIKKKLAAVSRRSWIKIIIIAALLVFALFKGIGVLDFIILFYASVSFLFVLDSRVAAGAALVSLASCPVLLILKNDALAETVAIYAYYFLVIAVLTQIRELKHEKKAENISE